VRRACDTTGPSTVNHGTSGRKVLQVSASTVTGNRVPKLTLSQQPAHHAPATRRVAISQKRRNGPPHRGTLPAVASTGDLATDLDVDEGDVIVLLKLLGEETPDMPGEVAAFLRRLLDPHGERTAAPNLFWPAAEDEPRRVLRLRRIRSHSVRRQSLDRR
jgi:hypothetical protein